MSKVVYETPQLRYEVQEAVTVEVSTLSADMGVTHESTGGWEPVTRMDDLQEAGVRADYLQATNRLNLYRVVDRFSEEG